MTTMGAARLEPGAPADGFISSPPLPSAAAAAVIAAGRTSWPPPPAWHARRLTCARTDQPVTPRGLPASTLTGVTIANAVTSEPAASPSLRRRPR